MVVGAAHLSGGSLSEAFPAYGVAVLLCCMALVLIFMRQPRSGYCRILRASGEDCPEQGLVCRSWLNWRRRNGSPGGNADAGDGDGIVSVYDPGNAIPSAAGYLQAHGATGNIQAALFSYNHSSQYVGEVLDGSPLCQQAALGPLPAGIAGKVIAYAEAQIRSASPTSGAAPARTPSTAPAWR